MVNGAAMAVETTLVTVKQIPVRVVTAMKVAIIGIAVVKDAIGTKAPERRDAMRAADATNAVMVDVHAVSARAVAVVRDARSRVLAVTRTVAASPAVAANAVATAARDRLASSAVVAAAARQPAAWIAVAAVVARQPATWIAVVAAVAKDPVASSAVVAVAARQPAAWIAVATAVPREPEASIAMARAAKVQALGAASQAAARAAAPNKRRVQTRAAALTKAVANGAVTSIKASAVINRGLTRASQRTTSATALKAPMQTETARAVNARSVPASVAAVGDADVDDAVVVAAVKVAIARAAEYRRVPKAEGQRTRRPG